MESNFNNILKVKVKQSPLQDLTGPEGSRRLRIPDFNLLALEFFKFF
jgi:hypothetical protein